MSKIILILCVLISYAILWTPANALEPIVISATPCFEGLLPNATFPILISVQNSGRSVRGAIKVHAQDLNSGRVYIYPVDLPSGTEKELIAYPLVHGYEPTIAVDFDGPVPARSALVNSGYGDENSTQVGFIGDEVAGLQSIRQALPGGSGQTTQGFVDSYCKPEDAPDRAPGYSSLNILVIGEGADRFSDDQWSAIKEWVMGGGSLLFLGGAGSLTYLETPGASMLCPLDNLHQDKINQFTFTPSDNPKTFFDVAIINGTPKPGASVSLSQDGAPLIVRQHCGAGLITMATFNPIAQPIRGTDGAPDIIKPLLRQSQTALNSQALFNWSQQQFGGMGNISGGEMSLTAASTEVPASGSAVANPFHIQLPPVAEVAWIFIAYFTLAIPVTFFVLRRMGRLEWAWMSTPIISILFAFVFYFYTANLYKVGMTRRTAGVVTASAGDPNAHFAGFSEIFFPHGGSYDIAIPNAESLEESARRSEDFSSGANTESLETTDTITGIAADDFTVGNLAFKRFYYSQPIQLGGTITTKISSSAPGISGQVTNNTGVILTNVQLTYRLPVTAPPPPSQPGPTTLHHYLDDQLLPPAPPPPRQPTSGVSDGFTYDPTYSLGTILPGQTVNVPKAFVGEFPTILRSVSEAPNMFDADSAYLTGTVPSSSFGLQMGNDVSGSSSVALVMSVPVTVLRATK